LEVAEYELNSNGNLKLARELLQRVAESNVEEVIRAAEMLKLVNQAIRTQHQAQAQAVSDSQQTPQDETKS